MFSFFKRNREKPLQNWQIPLEGDFRQIINRDSIQFVNADNTVFLYFSIMTFSGRQLLPGNGLATMEPSITRDENFWVLKGGKQGGNELLVCAFSFTNQTDESLVKDLFENIVYIGK